MLLLCGTRVITSRIVGNPFPTSRTRGFFLRKWYAPCYDLRVLFNTAAFFIFFTLVLLLYRALPHRAQNWMLLGASYVFYGWWDWRFLGLLGASTLLDWALALSIGAARDRGDHAAAKRRVVISAVANLGILAGFKYFNFFIDTSEHLLRALGYDGSTWSLRIILPVGISFYTFQSLSYIVDVYRGELRASKSLVDFALFVAFFPQLVAGPIERATRLLPQVQRRRVVTRTDWEEGALLFGVGLFRKVAIADPAGSIADAYFADPAAHTSVQLVAGVLLYSLQIYNDFAGYSDMARGSARLLGFTLMRNFRHPYFADSFSNFWQRWHISLSGWLRDYLYIPLGGNRRGRLRTHLNLMITMLLGGLWHGASWTFVAWGALHGLFLIAQHAWQSAVPPSADRGGLRMLRRAVAAAVVFALVNVAWVFFRAPDFPTAFAYLGGIAALTPGAEGVLIPVAVLAMYTLVIDGPQALANNEYVFLDWPAEWRALATSAACLILLGSGTTHAPFIYFQF
jgi:alginate O-acetyltransferase complex protein AlgI